MKTRRERPSIAEPVNYPSSVAPAVIDPSSSLPTQQQRLLAQLRTSMVTLNKKFGNGVTNEVLAQVITSLAFDQNEEARKHLNWKPEYSDVKIDSELATPPMPEEKLAVKSPRKSVLRPMPSWFNYEVISEAERALFGPLFSMDEERWKIYISLRNDIVKLYEDAILGAEKYSVFLTSSELRQRMHPKDDAAQIFELWKWLTSQGIINRGRADNEIMAAAEGSCHANTIAVPAQEPLSVVSTRYTPVKCSKCSRECKFICYKPIAVPASPKAEDTDEEMEDEPMADEEMVTEPVTTEEILLCHDCAPPLNEKIPLRLFIDKRTRDAIVAGEYEELAKDDVKYFIVGETDEHDVSTHPHSEYKGRKKIADNLMNYLFGKSTPSTVPTWDTYLGASDSSAPANPLEILDPLMQEALTNAGQKIRGSVLIEQQVRNMMYGAGGKNRNDEEIIPSCHPVSVEVAFGLIVDILAIVVKKIEQKVPEEVENSWIFTKSTHKIHTQILTLLYHFGQAAAELRRDLLGRVKVEEIREKVQQRLDTKKQYLEFLKSIAAQQEKNRAPLVKSQPHTGDSIFHKINDLTKTRLSSRNPQQINLASL